MLKFSPLSAAEEGEELETALFPAFMKLITAHFKR